MNDSIHLKSESLIFVGPVWDQPLNRDQLARLGIDQLPQIAVDGGDQFALDPVMVVGDGDSKNSSQQNSKPVPFLQKLDQDLTDLSFALQTVQSGRWTELHLFGFLGGRKDHELAAIGEVCRALGHRMDLTKAFFYHEDAGQYQVAFSVHNIGTHAFQHQGTFSVIAFENLRLTIAGQCQFLVRDLSLLPFSGRGVSNVAEGDFTIQSSGVFMMIPSRGDQ